MSDVIEKMAERHYVEFFEGVRHLEPRWDDLPEVARARFVNAMRAALEYDGWQRRVPEGSVVVPREAQFPMQKGPPIPWQTAEVIYMGYSALYGNAQTLSRLAERGGFGWAEVEHIFKECKLRRRDTYTAMISAGEEPKWTEDQRILRSTRIPEAPENDRKA